MTIFSPAATHFLVQASPPALAPLAPHLASVIQPFTVVLLPISSNAIADRANTKLNARQINRIFLMAGFSPFGSSDCGPKPQQSRATETVPPVPGNSESPLDCQMRHRKYTTACQWDCQREPESCARKLHTRKNSDVIFSQSEWPVGRAWLEPAEHRHIPPAWHTPTARALPFRYSSDRSSALESVVCNDHSPAAPAQSAFVRLRNLPVSA